ncbi:glycoside hydrolase family 3 C-terminal domain-containing protein [Bacteroidota bacterium]
MKKLFLTSMILVSIILLLTTCQSKQSGDTTTYDEVWKDPNQAVDDRVADLLSRMTLEEKVSQMVNGSAAIDRLSIPAYDWWSECLHGVARFGKATVYPQAIGLAATWDTDLIHRIGNANSDEGRASFHAAEAKGYGGMQYGGLTYWTPNINIFRDPRWGRGQETYGEDPYLTGKMGAALVKGIQGDHPKYLKAGACGKHYVVHSGPEGLRHEFNAIASKKDMYETYLYAFKELVDAGVESIMCAYNRTNDEACCGSELLLKGILRDEWGFEGHVVSDCWALRDFYEGHGVSSDSVEAAALALKSGVNVNCGNTFPSLLKAVEKGLISEAEIDESLSYLLRSRFRLGLFDPPELVPFTSISTDVIHCEKHQAIALEAAQKCIVMLKNENNALPLSPDMKSVYIIGPNASNLEVMLGNYFGLSGEMTTILEGIAGKMKPGSFVEYRPGTLLERESLNPIDWASSGAKNMDAIIACMGISPMLEGEEGESILSPTKGDRFDIKLPHSQVKYIKKLRDGYDKPIILVLTGGSPIDISEVADLVDAILFVWYPGEKGGNAIADVIFGDANPSGRLPITFPKSLDDLPPYDDYSMKGRTYRYMTKEPMYPFGFGLSYTSFSYEIADDELELNAGEKIDIEVSVSNTGQLEGEEVVQLYVSDLEASTYVPISALKGFQRISLKPGESKQVSFTVDNEMLKVVKEDGTSVVEPGQFRLTIGGSSPGPRSQDLGAPQVAEIILSVR